MLSYYSSILLISWMALLSLTTLIHENAHIASEDKRLLYLTYVLIFLASLSEWLGVHMNYWPFVPTWALKAVKCADYFLTPLAGGTLVIGDATVSKPPADQLEVGTHIVIPSPVRDGYLFVGWQDDDGNVHAPGSVLDSLASEDGEHVTLTAVWEKDPAAQEEPAKPEAPKDETEENDTSAVDASDETQQTADQTEEPLEDEQDSDKSPADTEEFEREKQRKEDSADVALVGGVAIPLSTVPQGPFEDVLPPVEEVRDDSRVEVILVLLGAIATAIVVIVALRMFDARSGGARRRSS